MVRLLFSDKDEKTVGPVSQPFQSVQVGRKRTNTTVRKEYT